MRILKISYCCFFLFLLSSCETHNLRYIDFVGIDPVLLCYKDNLQRPIHKGWISRKFGTEIDHNTGISHFHRGSDYSGKEDNPVYAVRTGVVIYSGIQDGIGKVALQTTNDNIFIYNYIHKYVIEEDDVVLTGALLGYVTSKNHPSNFPVLHFEHINSQGEYVDPKFLQCQK